MKKFMWIFVLLLLAACTPQVDTTDEGATPSGDVATATKPATAVGNTPAPEEATRGATPDGRSEIEVPADAAIVLKREGGMEGLMEQWTIYQDGRIVDAAGNEFTVPAEVVTGLVTTAASSGFFELPADMMPVDECCDRFTYWLAIRQGDTVHTVKAMDGEESVPEEFWVVVAAVRATIDAVSGG